MNKFHKINIGVYCSRLYVFFGEFDKFKKDVIKLGFTSDDIGDNGGANGMLAFHYDKGLFAIWVKELPHDTITYSDLAHEISHFVFRLLDYKGLRHTPESDEAYAYLTGYISWNIYEIIESIKKKNDTQK